MDFNSPPPDDTRLPAVLADLNRRARHADPKVRHTAFEQLYEVAYKVGAKAASAIPVLVEGLVDPDAGIGEKSLWALKYCAPDSIEPLIECLSHQAGFVRERAAHSLGNVGDEASAAASALRGLLHDPEQAVRRRGAWALGLLHDAHPETLSLLAGLLANGTTEDCSAALHSLANIGKNSDSRGFLAPYRPQILAAFDSPDDGVRRWALYAAESMGLEPQAMSDLLVSVVDRDASSEVRSAALSTLTDFATSVDLTAALPVLTSRLAEPGRDASKSCEILGLMRPAPTEAIPFLREALSRDELVLPAAAALWRIEGHADSILPALMRVFKSDGEGVCDLICEMGPAASPILPSVLDALAEENWDLQWAAADALCAIASTDQAVLSGLLDALAHPSSIVRSASARALAATGVAAVSALKALLADTADPRAPWAAYALGEMGPVAAEALSGLRVRMRENVEPLATFSAIAVARIAADVEALPYLVAALRSESPQAPRRSAAMALAELGPAANGVDGTLEALIDDDDPGVEEAAITALVSIRGLAH